MGLFDFFRKRGEKSDQGRAAAGPQGSNPPRGENGGGGGGDGEGLESLIRRVQERQRAGPERPLIYTFEHHTLRREVFENHPELPEDLAGDRGEKQFWHAITNAEILCEGNGYVGQAGAAAAAAAAERGLYADPYELERELLGRVSIHPVKRGGYTAYVLTMPEPEFSPEAHFIAIVHRDDEPHEYMTSSPSTRYFTLEKTREAPQPLPCEWDAQGRHRNFGMCLAAEHDAFVEWVFGKVLP